MGKHEAMTPKAIKARGLQKLRWYCQMCQKQCRDENGFKCHCSSDSHIRQMQLWGENRGKLTSDFSSCFESTFLRYAKHAGRVLANHINNEMIKDRHHIHMNSTRWSSLTSFVQYLGRTGKCKVEDTPKGWYITYIDRDPETLLKKELKKKRDRGEADLESLHQKELEAQIKRAKSSSSCLQEEAKDPKLFLRTSDERKVAFSLPKKVVPKAANEDQEGSTGEEVKEWTVSHSNAEDKRHDDWLFEGIVVKVLARKLQDGAYYNKKGVVKKVLDKYVGEIEMLDTGDIVRVDQAELETVVPNIGGRVKVVNGAHRGCEAKLLLCDIDRFCCSLQIGENVVSQVAYEDFCKLSL